MRNRFMTVPVLATSLWLLASAVPASSWGSVTIGANLAVLTPAIAGYNCGTTHQCTVTNTSLIPSVTASGGFASPVKGSVTSFQVRTGSSAAPIQLRVLRPAGNQYTGAGTGGAVTPPTNQISPPFPVNLPILPGEIVALNCCLNGASNNNTSASPIGNFATWGTGGFQALGDGETREPDSGTHDGAMMVSAQVEPDNSFTLGTAKATGRTVSVDVTVPNPGVLKAGDPGDATVAVAAKKKKKKKKARLLRLTTLDVAAGTATLVVNLTKAGRARLKRAGKLKVKVVYTPNFGTAATQKTKARR
jgi:hypothetical protein